MVTATSSAVLAVNVGSSSVKCALFTFCAQPRLIVRTAVDGIGSSCTPRLLDWVDQETAHVSLKAIGHRLVHGGPHYSGSQRITPAVLDTLAQLIPFAPNHLPDEIALINALGQHCASVPQ